SGRGSYLFRPLKLSEVLPLCGSLESDVTIEFTNVCLANPVHTLLEIIHIVSPDAAGEAEGGAVNKCYGIV
ncbi:hypothetical protein MO867_20980, partial [Microbulbifer sp. OS29]